MRSRRKAKRVLKFAAVAIVAAALFGFVVMGLWNWLIPAVFGWQPVGFLQAIGLLVLARILFGGFRGDRHPNWRRRIHERWDAMTPEERERFRAGFPGERERFGDGVRGRCGHAGPPPSQAAPPPPAPAQPAL
jgi:hypothetical protein